MTYMARSKRDLRGKLQTISLGLYPDQVTHIEVLERVTGKTKGRIIRECLDAYLADQRITERRPANTPD